MAICIFEIFCEIVKVTLNLHLVPESTSFCPKVLLKNSILFIVRGIKAIEIKQNGEISHNYGCKQERKTNLKRKFERTFKNCRKRLGQNEISRMVVEALFAWFIRHTKGELRILKIRKFDSEKSLKIILDWQNQDIFGKTALRPFETTVVFLSPLFNFWGGGGK